MSDEKTEEPTSHKLHQAREEGQMARSQDIAAAASMLAAVGALVATADTISQRLHAIMGLALDFSRGSFEMDAIYKRMAAMALETVMAIAPVVIAAAAGAAFGMVAHVGFQISPKAVQLKLDSLNPAQGMKKIISMKSLLTFVQMVVKAAVIGVVAWQAILRLLPLVAGAVYESPDSIGTIAWKAVVQLLWFALAVFVVFGPVDFLIQHHTFMKGQRMSKDEVKREHKGQEGDPEVKGQRKQLAREFAEEAPRQAVARADAVIVNPTHYAVAVRYRAEELGVPVVLAKGLDDAALRLRRHAEELGVPVFAHPPLARALHKVPIDHSVPEELFEAMSVVLRWVDEIGARRAAGETP
jgi:type III secretion protein U